MRVCGTNSDDAADVNKLQVLWIVPKGAFTEAYALQWSVLTGRLQCIRICMCLLPIIISSLSLAFRYIVSILIIILMFLSLSVLLITCHQFSIYSFHLLLYCDKCLLLISVSNTLSKDNNKYYSQTQQKNTLQFLRICTGEMLHCCCVLFVCFLNVA